MTFEQRGRYIAGVSAVHICGSWGSERAGRMPAHLLQTDMRDPGAGTAEP